MSGNPYTSKAVNDKVCGILVESNSIFTNHKGIYKKRIEGRQKKLLQKISSLKYFLKEGERVFFIVPGCSPMSFMEQFFTGWIIYYLKRSLLAFTNKRIFHIPTTVNYSFRNSIAQISYSDCLSIRIRGGALEIKYKNGKKERFYCIPRGYRKKIKVIVETLNIPDKERGSGGRVYLCPRCGKELAAGNYRCPHCRLEFKNEEEARRISIIYPGGGYFYTRHFWLGIGDAFTESALIVLVIVFLIEAMQGNKESLVSFIFVLAVLIFEKFLTIYHCRQFIKEFIPKDSEVRPRRD